MRLRLLTWALNKQASLKEGNRGFAGVNMVIGALVVVVIAIAILPEIYTQVNTATGTGGALEGSGLENLVDFWPLLVVIGVMLAIIGTTIKGRGKD